MKCRLMKFPLIHLLLSFNSLTATLFHSFVRKNVFYSKNIQYAYNFYGTDLNVCRGVFRTRSNIYGGASLRKSQKSFIVDARLGSKYVSGIGFTVEGSKVYRSHYFSDILKIYSTSKICHCVLVSSINKIHFGLTKKV